MRAVGQTHGKAGPRFKKKRRKQAKMRKRLKVRQIRVGLKERLCKNTIKKKDVIGGKLNSIFMIWKHPEEPWNSNSQK